MNKITCEVKEPLIWMHFPNHPTDEIVKDWLNELDTLLLHAKKRIVISTFAPHYQFSTVARRHQALWFKRNKNRLAELCLAMVRVTQDEEMIAKITSNAMRQGMPFHCIPAKTLLEAETIALNLLIKHNKQNLG